MSLFSLLIPILPFETEVQMKKIIILIGLVLTNISQANGLKPDCKSSKNPSWWDTSNSRYQQRVCPADFNSDIIVIGVKNSGASKECSAYTISEYELIIGDSSVRISPMQFDCSRTSITFGTILNGTIGYRPFMMRNGDTSCWRYLKGINQ